MRKITLLLIVFILTDFAYAQSGFSSDYPSLDKASITSLETRVAVAGIPGETCENPINIASLPYTTSDNTSNYGNNYTGVPGSNCGTSNNFLTGDDVVYEYTAISNTTLNITMTPMVGWTGIFVYTDCANINTACVAGVANSNPTPRVFDLAVTNGTTYYFLISGSAPPQSIQYTLIIKDKNCTAVTANFKVVNDCNNSGGFFIDVNVTAMGSATNLTISDDLGSWTKTLSAVGTVQFGPYANGTAVVITIDDDHDDGSCTVTSTPLTQTICPPPNETCATATVIECGDTLSGTSEGSTGTPEDINCNDGIGIGNSGVWYTFIGVGGEMTVTVDATFDHKLGITSGTCGSLVNMECVDLSGGQETYTIDNSVLGETYYVYIARWSAGNTTTGVHTISLNCPTVSVNGYNSPEIFTYRPNPVSKTLHLNAKNNINTVSVYNMLGQEVIRTVPNAINSEVDMSALKTGTYFVKVTINGAEKTIKVLRQ